MLSGPYLFGWRVIVGAPVCFGVSSNFEDNRVRERSIYISLHISSATQRGAHRQGDDDSKEQSSRRHLELQLRYH
jgi:hypothetical protein